MADETPNTMNLDLNLEPVVNSSQDDVPGSMNLEDWLEGPVREAIRQRTRARQTWRSVWRRVPMPVESENIALDLNNGNGLEAVEGSVAAEERPSEVLKTFDKNEGFLEDAEVAKKENVEKGNGDSGSFFDCNICLDLAGDPVVTCCGHLFCWPCLYRWLHLHSDSKECPICKGEVTIKNVTPIYGRGNVAREPEEDSSLKIPHRPLAHRVESWRQTIHRNAFTIPMEEMIRRLGSRFDLSRDLIHPHPLLAESAQEYPERSNSLLTRFLTSRGMRREQSINATSAQPDAIVDSTQNSPTNDEGRERGSRRLSSLASRRSNRAATISNLTSALSSAERLMEYFWTNPVERNQEQAPAVDDRDSVSSIAAVIQSGSQTLDTTVEIESRISHSTSSSSRRHHSSRISDVDSGDSHAPRRRRLH